MYSHFGGAAVYWTLRPPEPWETPLLDRLKSPQFIMLSALVTWVLAWGARAALLDGIQPGSDSILGHVIRIQGALAAGDRGLAADLLLAPGWHPPLPVIYGLLVTSVLGVGMGVIRLSSVFLHCVALVQTYLLARRAACTRDAALLAGGLVAALPMITGWFRTDFPEPLTTVFVLATHQLALRCDLQKDRRRALALGLVLGLGLLCKLGFAVFAFFPAVFFLALRLRTRTAAINAGLAALVAGAVCGWWYWMNLDAVLENLGMSSKHIRAVAAGEGSFLFRLKLLTGMPELYPLLAAAAAGVALAWRRRLLPRQELLLLTVFWAAPVLLLVGLFDILSRYLLPILPLCCLLTGLALHHLARDVFGSRGRRWRQLSLGLMALALCCVSLLTNLLPQPLDDRDASGILNPYTGRLDAFTRATSRAAAAGLPVLIASAHMQASEWSNNQILLYGVSGEKQVSWLDQVPDAERELERGQPVAVLVLTASFGEARPNEQEKDIRREARRWLSGQRSVHLGTFADTSPFKVSLYRVQGQGRR